MRRKSILSIAVLGVLFAAACAKRVDDSALLTSIKAQMFSDAQLKDASLEITATNGQVTLRGTVTNEAAHLDAYKIAAQTPGVKKVLDQITVETAQTAQVQALPSARPAAKPATENTGDRPKQSAEKGPSSAPGDENRNPGQPVASSEPEPVPAPPQIPQQDQPSPPPAITPNPAAAPPPPPEQVQIPAGTTLSVRMIDGVDSSVNKPGEIFHAALDVPVMLSNQIVVPKNADIYVRLAISSSAGRMSGQSELRLELVKLEFQGQSYPLDSSTYALSGSSRSKDTAKKVGAGAVVGTLLGAIVGGGKGAAIGAAAGGAAGGVYQASTRGKQVKVPSETKLDFQLEQPVTVTVIPPSLSAAQ
ncbi:MAG TPA: BON domain-containing protein [Candidatus Cybelea sp.]|nr:BON domain-containing protein [Candidatus Cybelea sp.]